MRIRLGIHFFSIILVEVVFLHLLIKNVKISDL